MHDTFRSAGQVLQHYRTLSHPDVLDKARQFVIADQMAELGLNPYFAVFERSEGTEAVVEGKHVLMFGSNNYLGLTQEPSVQAAVQDAVSRYGTSYTGSRLLNGTSKLHLELEQELADFLGKESAIVFSTGYQANLGVLTAILNGSSVLLYDQYSHASIRDGGRLSDGPAYSYPHNDADALDRLLEEHQSGDRGCLVATDGLFSMHGDLAPLDELAKVVRKHGARLLVDDAHSVGTVGHGGRGTGARFGVEDDVDLIVGTFSKTLASIGGFAAGERAVTNFVKHFGNAMIFSASLAPPNLAAARAALQVLRDEPERVDRVNRTADTWRDGLAKLGFRTHGETPVVPVILGDDLMVFRMWRELLNEGLYVNAAVWPSVPKGGGLLRTSVMATHTEDQVQEALGLMERVGKRVGAI